MLPQRNPSKVNSASELSRISFIAWQSSQTEEGWFDECLYLAAQTGFTALLMVAALSHWLYHKI